MDVREIREALGMNQSQFWGALGVTQSGGSRYESGRRIPKPVRQQLGAIVKTTDRTALVQKINTMARKYRQATASRRHG